MQDQNQSDKAKMDQVALEAFVDQLIKDRNDTTLTDQEKPHVKALLLAQVNEAINTHMINRLSEKDQLELDDLLNQNAADQQLNDFFAKKIANLPAEIASALLNFRVGYLGPTAMQQPNVSNESVDVSAPPPPPPVAPKSN